MSIATEAERRMSTFNAQDLADTAWAFASVSLLDEKLFSSVVLEAEPRASEFNTSNLARLHQCMLSSRITKLRQRLSPSLAKRCLDAWQAAESRPCSLQQKVVAALAKLSSDVQQDFVTEQG
eukprot:gnl/TRDRNA2_/TRDRNA2_177884_c0_seq3.p1 gnl/TRDRNA2_/TRDRNA2_177884_c0~~gnl/TRDRNA2_/TRDRNA2_177884_c0_seq3.p1  ORF type:complete len:122 (+),score=26.70 gnl/TRDRNA2_/TRDRNA2_177884_c0_seq3:48-413(+)